MIGDQFVDEPGRFQLVEQADAMPEAGKRKLLDAILVELVLVHDFEDEVALLIGTFPAAVERTAGAVEDSGAIGAVDTWGAAIGAVGALAVVADVAVGHFHAVGSRWNKAGLLHLPIDVLLEQFVEAVGFSGNVGCGCQFGFDRDAELMRRVPGQS